MPPPGNPSGRNQYAPPKDNPDTLIHADDPVKALENGAKFDLETVDAQRQSGSKSVLSFA